MRTLPAVVVAAVLFCAQALLAPLAHAQALQEPPRDLLYVGYHPSPRTPQVQITTNEPVSAHLETVNRHLVVVHLDSCLISKRINTLPLDTSFFTGPVDRIEAIPIEGPSVGVRLEIQLRRPSDVHMRQSDNKWLLTFSEKPKGKKKAR